MFLKGFLFIVLIILSGIFLLVSAIFFIIRLANDHPKKWNWLAAVLIALVIFVSSIFLFVRKVVNKAKEVGQNFEKQIQESFAQLDTTSSFRYSLLDSNSTVKILRSFESKNNSEKVPDEFYTYLGFRDYYRMPLRYPFSLHCIDVLETASLFNEKYVVNYDVSDNGEIDCQVNDITGFAFDKKILIAKQTSDSKEKYIIYEFATDKQSFFHSQEEAFKTAKNNFKYSGADTLISVMNYHLLFN
jgi:hypothetical protein